jgi:hypothetical protein
LNKDPNQANIGIAVTFTKYYLPFFYPLEQVPEDKRDDGVLECVRERQSICSDACCTRVYALLIKYYTESSAVLLKGMLELDTQQYKLKE